MSYETTSNSLTYITGVPKGNKGQKKFEEITAEKCLNLIKIINLQVQEAQQNSNTRNMKRTILRYIIIKLFPQNDRTS